MDVIEQWKDLALQSPQAADLTLQNVFRNIGILKGLFFYVLYMFCSLGTTLSHQGNHRNVIQREHFIYTSIIYKNRTNFEKTT